MNVHQSLTSFIEEYCKQVPDSKRLVEFDAKWPSPCVKGEGHNNGELVSWSPVLQQPKSSFDNVEDALDITLHSDFKTYFSTYWSDNLSAVASQGDCELLQVWNLEDFKRLQENLIGHVLMKRRLNQSPTLFFAVTDDEDFILSIHNETGQVVLEPVGKEPTKILADSMASFIQSLTVPSN